MAKLSESEIIIRLLEFSKNESLRIENQAEKRVGFFLTVASASIAFWAYLFSQNASSDYITLTFLIVLLAYGLETLQFLNWTKIHQRTNKNDEILNDAFSKLSETSKELAIETENIKNRIPKDWSYGIRGGLAEFMYLTNSFIFTGIVFVVLRHAGLSNIFKSIILFITFITFIFIQYIFSKSIREIGSEKKKGKGAPPNQALKLLCKKSIDV
jgi:hypothetical protein